MHSQAYGQLWRVVDGAVTDAFGTHPDYLTPKGRHSAKTSVVKRVTGTVLSFAVQAARGRPQPAATATRAVSCEPPAGGFSHLPASFPPHCRIGRIRFKRRSRYRAAQAFDITTSALVAAMGAKR
jgi:hypothetical protein